MKLFNQIKKDIMIADFIFWFANELLRVGIALFFFILIFDLVTPWSFLGLVSKLSSSIRAFFSKNAKNREFKRLGMACVKSWNSDFLATKDASDRRIIRFKSLYGGQDVEIGVSWEPMKKKSKYKVYLYFQDKSLEFLVKAKDGHSIPMFLNVFQGQGPNGDIHTRVEFNVDSEEKTLSDVVIPDNADFRLDIQDKIEAQKWVDKVFSDDMNLPEKERIEIKPQEEIIKLKEEDDDKKDA